MNSVLRFSIYSVLRSKIRSFGFLFIWSSGFGLPYQLESGGLKSHVDSPLAKRKDISKKKSKTPKSQDDNNDESENSSDGLFTFLEIRTSDFL